MNYNRQKIRLPINKKYKEFMEGFKESSDASYNSSEEDFSWAKKKNNDELKKLYIEYQFKKWKEILNIDFSNKKNYDGPIYLQNIYKIFKEDIFKNDNVIIETNNIIFKEYILKDFEIKLSYELFPDFIIKDINKKTLWKF